MLRDGPHGRDSDDLAAALAVPQASTAKRPKLTAQRVVIPSGFSTCAADLYAPCIRVKVRPFRILPTAVTNADFATFVADSSCKAVAER